VLLLSDGAAIPRLYSGVNAPKITNPTWSSEIVADIFPVSSEMTRLQPRPPWPPCMIILPYSRSKCLIRVVLPLAASDALRH